MIFLNVVMVMILGRRVEQVSILSNTVCFTT